MAGKADIRAGRAFVELMLKNSLSKGLTLARRQLQDFGDSAARIGRQLTALSAATATPFAFSAKKFMEFDDAMRAVQGVTQATASDLAMLTDTAKKLGATTSFTAVQVGQLMIELGRAGFTADQIDKMTGSVLAMSRATGTDAAMSATILGDAIHQFRLEAGEATRVADAMTATANKSATSIEGLGESLQYVGPVANEANMSLEDTLAILGALGNVGIRGSEAGTALRRLLTLTAAEADKMRGIFGVAFKDAAGNARPLVDVLAEVNEKTKNMATAKRASKFNEAFGLLGITSASAIGKNIGSIKDLQRELMNAAGVAADTAAKMDGGLGGAFRRMMSAIEGVQIAFGEALAPALTSIAKQVETLSGSLIKFIGENQHLAVSLVVAVGHIGALGLALIATKIATVGLVAMMGVLKVAILPAAAAFGLLKASAILARSAIESTAKALERLAARTTNFALQATTQFAKVTAGVLQMGYGFVQAGTVGGLMLARQLIAAGPTILAAMQKTGQGIVTVMTFHVSQLSQAFAPLAAKIGQWLAPIGAKINAAIGPAVRKAFFHLSMFGIGAAEKVSQAWARIAPHVQKAASWAASTWAKYTPVIARNLVSVVGGAFSRIRAIASGTVRAIAAGAGNMGGGLSRSLSGLGGLAMLFGGASGGILGQVMMAIPMVMSLVNPFTLLVGAIAAAAVGWVKFGEGGQKAFKSITELLRPFAETFSQVWGGIRKAMESGDLMLAGKIAFAGLKVMAIDAFNEIGRRFQPLADLFIGAWDVVSTFWGQAVKGMKVVWDGFAGFFQDGTEDAGTTWGDFVAGLVTVFADAAKYIADIWRDTTTGIAKMMLKSKLITGNSDAEKEDARGKMLALQQAEAERKTLARAQAELAEAQANGGTLGRKGEFGTTEADIAENIRQSRERLAVAEGKAYGGNGVGTDVNFNDLMGDAESFIEKDLKSKADSFKSAMDGLIDRANKRSLDDSTGIDYDAARRAQDDLDALIAEQEKFAIEMKALSDEEKAAGSGAVDGAKNNMMQPGTKNPFVTTSAAALIAQASGGTLQQQQLQAARITNAELKKANKSLMDALEVRETQLRLQIIK